MRSGDSSPARRRLRRSYRFLTQFRPLLITAFRHKSPPRPKRASQGRAVLPVGLIPVTVRLRAEIAGALKRASLERQLGGVAVFTQQELVEAALEPWLRRHGYLD